MTLVACHDQPERSVPASALYVASVPDTDVAIAIVVDGDRVVGYACGDDPRDDDYTGWFRGTRDAEGRFTLVRGGWTLEGAVVDGTATGALAEGDRRIAWSAARVSGRDLTGLYVVRDSGCETGVIVTNDGVRGMWCDDTGIELPVTPIVPLELVEDRLVVRVPDAGARRLLTTPVVDRAGLLQVRDL